MSPQVEQVLTELRGHTAKDWIFTTLDGQRPLGETTCYRAWCRLQKRFAGAGVRSLKLHCARHTFATLALNAGMSVRWVAAQLGHADPAFTLRVYTHVLPDEGKDLGFLDFGG